MELRMLRSGVEMNSVEIKWTISSIEHSATSFRTLMWDTCSLSGEVTETQDKKQHLLSKFSDFCWNRKRDRWFALNSSFAPTNLRWARCQVYYGEFNYYAQKNTEAPCRWKWYETSVDWQKSVMMWLCPSSLFFFELYCMKRWTFFFRPCY